MRGSSERGRRSTEPSCPLATITCWQRGEGMFLQGGPWCFQGTVGFWPDPASPESCLQTTPVFQVDIACPDWQAHSLHFACLSCWNSNFNLAAFLFFPLATINGVDSSPKPKTHVKNVKNTSKFLDVTSSHIHKETKAFLNTDMKTFRQKGVKDPLNQTKSTRWVTQSSSEYTWEGLWVASSEGCTRLLTELLVCPKHYVKCSTYRNKLSKDKHPHSYRLEDWGMGFPGGSVVKNPPASAGYMGLILDPADPTYHGTAKPRHHNYWTCALEPGGHS